MSNIEQEFLDTYRKLGSLEQSVVKCLSIQLAYLGKSKLLGALWSAGATNNSGKEIGLKDLSGALAVLVKKDFIISDKKGSICHPEIRSLATQCAVDDRTFGHLALGVLENSPTLVDWNDRPYYQDYASLLRDLRIAVYLREDSEFIILLLDHAKEHFYESFQEIHPFDIIILDQTDPDLFTSLDPKVMSHFLVSYLHSAFTALRSVLKGLEIAELLCTEPEFIETDLPYSVLLHRMCRGNFVEARELLKKLPASVEMYSYLGWLELLEGDYQKSLQTYRSGLEFMRKTTRKRKLAYANFAGVFYAVALLQSGDQKNIQEAVEYIQTAKKAKTDIADTICTDIHQALVFHTGMHSKAQLLHHSLGVYRYRDCRDALSTLIAFLTECWQQKKPSVDTLPQLEKLAEMGYNNGYFFLAKEAFGLLSQSEFSALEDAQTYEQLHGDIPYPSLFQRVQPKPRWQQALTALNALGTTPEKESVAEQKKQERVIWQLKNDDDWGLQIVPRLQKLGKNGKWTKGRAVGLSTLYSSPEKINCLSSQDVKIAGTLKQSPSSNYYYGGRESYSFNEVKAFHALVDHPQIYFEDNLNVTIELKGGTPEFHVKKVDDGFELFLKPYMESGELYRLEQETPTRLRYIASSEEYKKIRDIVGQSLTVPLAQQKEIAQALGNIAGLVTVHSDIDIKGASTSIDTMNASAKVYVHLFPAGDGLSINILCKPLEDGGQYCRPGQGGKTVLSEIAGKQVQIERDLSLEVHNSLRVVEECRILQEYTPVAREWFIENPEDCLELLVELQNIGDEVVVEWPKEESFQLAGEISAQSVSLQIKKEREWFEASGTVAVSDDLVLTMKDLLSLCGKSTTRFVTLDDGRFLALSNRFKQQLDELRAFSEMVGEQARFHSLASQSIADLTKEVKECEADSQWHESLARFENTPVQELPSTLRAQLRDYQVEGFQWLARLSSWQVGGCLADDMGLGKTVQALSALLLRAPEGPSLVVAPTSVMMNWIDEAKRFAPTLNVKLFAEGNRQEILDGLEPFDLLICSYGLLQSETEKLSQVQWQTAILDEAQAIKNMQTKRSKAAIKLQAHFKLITTGTPIENHLGELWSLFRFINPGLLGSYESFRKKFATPIEREGDKTASARLRKLIQPYILRRLKGEVLQELPSRTEVNIQVEMSEEEAAMYEAQRQNAVDAISLGTSAGDEQYFQVLVEITRLRQFCCNPHLVVPEANLGSAKLDVFTELVQELVANNHKALVFSQFVGHLGLIQERLESLGISYQYLDGSTPVKQRAARVKAFQSGTGDVFLISLKAGGSGLNLTAADYVIHMDPWWNPAVEDQASDRAHRIGQQRPVTIYRLIVKDSIEEKIVALHRNKRDLADSLLAGSDMSGSFSASQLLALLKEK